MVKGPVICISGGKKDAKNKRIINEDIVVTGKNYAILMDGATGLGDFDLQENLTNAEWYVQECSRFIQQKLEENSEQTLPEIVTECINYIKRKIDEKQNEKGYKLKPYEEPSSSLIILRERENKTSLFSLGDSITMVKSRSNGNQVIREDNLCRLDQQVLSRMRKIADDRGVDVLDTREEDEIKEMLRVNREKKNSGLPDGYWILGTDIEAISHAKTFEYRSDDIEKIICVSDGFNYELLGLDEEGFLRCCNAGNIDIYAENVRRAAEEDSKCNKMPRFKKSDDCSGFVWIPKLRQLEEKWTNRYEN